MLDIHELDSEIGLQDIGGWKKGVRVLGVSESFQRSDASSRVAAVVMRGDMRIDGIGFCGPRVGGTDATEQLISMYGRLARDDIRAWMLGGCIISWFNIVDTVKLYESTNVPVVCVSYNPSEGIERYIREYFPDDWQVRVNQMDRGGPREKVSLKTGHSVFIATAGLGLKKAQRLVDQFTLDGRVPEPVRVARIVASAIKRDFVTL
ncbi:MAG: endonuclease dU [Candidatus Thorarchaeota archaeon]